MPLNIHLPDELKPAVESRVAELGMAIDEYMAALVRADIEADVSEELERELLRRVEGGPPIAVDERFWEKLRNNEPVAPTDGR